MRFTEVRRSRFGLFLGALAIDLVYLLAAPFLLLALLIASRGLTRPKLRRGLLRKLWCPDRRRTTGPSIWVHAVSVGEVLTAAPLVRALRARFPDSDMSVSVSTYTGFEVARQQLPEHDVFWFPADPSPCVNRAFRMRRPSIVALVELEVWPGFLIAAARRRVPVVVVNGRLTERSCRRYARFGAIARGLFGLVGAYAVQTDAYAERFRRLGVDAERIEVLGNLKHDRPRGVDSAATDALRHELGWPRSGHALLVAGCTHPGEERILCDLLPRLRAIEPGLRLVLAPRHVERLGGTEEDRWGCDRPIVRWSGWRSAKAGERPALGDSVLLVDTVGELELFYAAADMAFVGGSLVEHGGHNAFEPAAHGRATCFGPHTENFRFEVDALLAADAALQVSGAEELEIRLAEWLRDPAARAGHGARAAAAVDALRGAIERHVEWIAGAVDARGSAGGR